MTTLAQQQWDGMLRSYFIELDGKIHRRRFVKSGEFLKIDKDGYLDKAELEDDWIGVAYKKYGNSSATEI